MIIATSCDLLSPRARRSTGTGILLLVLALLPSLLHAGSSGDRPGDPIAASAVDSLPIVFRDGGDPLNPRLLYRGDGARGRVGFTREGVSYGFRRGDRELVIGLAFEGSRDDLQVVAQEGMRVGGGIYSFTGTGSSPTIIRQYSEIFYRGVYDGIDIRYHGLSGSLKYDCIVTPGADPSRIRMRYDGVDRLAITGAGDLEVVTSWGNLVERHPYVYQIVDGVEKRIEASFRIVDDKSFGFEIGAYDRSLPLVIDPMVLAWSTFVGGAESSGLSDGYVLDMTVDAAGDVYCTGWYTRTFPTTSGVYDSVYNGGAGDAYVFKLSSDGRRLLFSTFIGGSAREISNAIALGRDGSIYIGGRTISQNFPVTTPGYGTVLGEYDCFIVKLSNDGSRLLYSSRFGGNGNDSISRIDVDAAGAVTATGLTQSTNYPTTDGAYDEAFNGNPNFNGPDAFVTRLSSDAQGLVFSTFIGGAGSDVGTDLVVDVDGETVVSGVTSSNGFPTTQGAYDRTRDGNDAFLLRLGADGKTLRYSTLFGGSQNDGANALALGQAGRVVIAGYSSSADMPTTRAAFDRDYADDIDGFVAILDNNGTRLVAASYVGSGDDLDEIQDVVIDDDGSIFVAGKTESFDAVRALCPIGGASDGYDDNMDIYVARMRSDLGAMLFADFIGGEENDYGTRIALNPDRCRRELVVSITSHSPDFPTTAGVYQRTKLNSDDDQPTVMKIRPAIVPAFRATISCADVAFTDSTVGACIWGDASWKPTTWLWDFGDGTTSTEQHPKHTYARGGAYRVVLKVGCPRDSIVDTVMVPGAEPLVAHIGQGHTASPGDTVGIPMILDAVGAASPVSSLRIALHYDSMAMRLINVSPYAIDSLFHGSILADWRMTVDTLRNGVFSARFVAPSNASALTEGGPLLYLRFMTYIRPDATPESPWTDTADISFDISASISCGTIVTDPGDVQIGLCGLSYRLIEMGAEKYALTLGPPNPFTGPIALSFSLGLDGPTTITVFDATGTRVATLLDRHLDEGRYSMSWDGADLPSGLYYVRIVSGDWTETSSMIKRE